MKVKKRKGTVDIFYTEIVKIRNCLCFRKQLHNVCHKCSLSIASMQQPLQPPKIRLLVRVISVALHVMLQPRGQCCTPL